MKVCTKCKFERDLSNFNLSFNKDKSKSWLKNKCKFCEKADAKIYRENNKTKIKEKNKVWKQNNPEKIKMLKKNFYQNHRDELLDIQKEYNRNHKEEKSSYDERYYQENKEEISIYNRDYFQNNKDKVNSTSRKNYQNNFHIRLRKVLSSSIRISLFDNNGTKNGSSILTVLQYSIADLKLHLEKLFEPWMNWNNYGIYSRETWDDNDQNTWTWQIDHILPQADLPFSSMEDENFKKCWQLENLRPYSAKQNLLDGTSKIRHKSK
jgi:hypothetical protein